MRARRKLLLGCAVTLLVPLLGSVPSPAGAGAGDHGLLVAASGSPINVGQTPNAVVSADFNGDGHADLATATQNGSNVAVSLGNGAGGFAAAPGSPFVVPHPRDLAVGLLNDDAIPDLVAIEDNPACCGQTDRLYVLPGTGTGAFAAAVPGAVLGQHAGSLAVDDVTGDGEVDAVVTVTTVAGGIDEHGFVVLPGVGNGTFAAAINVTDRVMTGTGTNGPSGLATGDVDGNGIDDVALANLQTTDVSIWLATGTGFTQGQRVPLTQPTGDVRLTRADADADLDLVVANSSNGVAVLSGNGAGGFGTPTYTGLTDSISTLALTDVNDDGVDDVIASSFNASFHVLVGNGTGGYARGWVSPYPAANVSSATGADFNGDGYGDVALTNNSANQVVVMLTVLDNAAPVTSLVVDPPLPASGWFQDTPLLYATAQDVGLSGLKELRCSTDPFTVPTSFAQLPSPICTLQPQADGVHHFYAASLDKAGNAGLVVGMEVPIDGTSPSTLLVLLGQATRASGWYPLPPDVQPSSSDQTSGVVSTRCVVDPPQPPTSYDDLPDACVLGGLAVQGLHTVYAASVDAAGNESSVAQWQGGFDQTPPELTLTVEPETVVQGEPAQVIAELTDQYSGVADLVCDPPALDTSVVGDHVVSCTATDGAGNQATDEASYTVLPPPNAGVTLTVARAPGTRLAIDAVVTNDSVPDVGDLVITVPASLRVDSAPGCTVAGTSVTCPLVAGEVMSERSLLVTPRSPGPHSLAAAISPEDADVSDDTDSAVAGTALVCDNAPTGAADAVVGGSSADILCGLGGNDTFRGLAGNDLIFGGSGLDLVSYAGAPATSVDLRLQGLGLVGAHAVSGTGHGKDSFTGIERARGGSFADLLIGSGLANLLQGGLGADVLRGLGGVDRLEGGDGGDSLTGGDGKDVLVGGSGSDLCREATDTKVSCER